MSLARLRGADDVARFMRVCVGDDPPAGPSLIVLGVDRECWIVGGAVNNDRVSHTVLTPDEMLLLREECDADALVLVEIHVGEPTVPDLVEAYQFRILAEACEAAGVTLLDCLVMCGHHWWSLRELLPRSDDSGIRGCNRLDWAL